jgi:hypothetical protein
MQRGFARLAPGALQTVGRRNNHRFVVSFGGVVVDGGRGLCTQVAGLRVEVESADAMGTVRAGELHAALDALDSVGFHLLNCSPYASRCGEAMVRQRK